MTFEIVQLQNKRLDVVPFSLFPSIHTCASLLLIKSRHTSSHTHALSLYSFFFFISLSLSLSLSLSISLSRPSSRSNLYQTHTLTKVRKLLYIYVNSRSVGSIQLPLREIGEIESDYRPSLALVVRWSFEIDATVDVTVVRRRCTLWRSCSSLSRVASP